MDVYFPERSCHGSQCRDCRSSVFVLVLIRRYFVSYSSFFPFCTSEHFFPLAMVSYSHSAHLVGGNGCITCRPTHTSLKAFWVKVRHPSFIDTFSSLMFIPISHRAPRSQLLPYRIRLSQSSLWNDMRAVYGPLHICLRRVPHKPKRVERMSILQRQDHRSVLGRVVQYFL